MGIADDTWGEIVAVAAVLKPGHTLSLEQLQAWSRDRLSSYKCPRRLLIVDDLPRGTMGKVTRPAVRELFLNAREGL